MQQHPLNVRVPTAQPNTLLPWCCQVLLSQTAQQTTALVREQPSSTERTYPADKADGCWRLQRGKDSNRAGGTCRSKCLADTACQHAELLTKHLRKAVKKCWENTLWTLDRDSVFWTQKELQRKRLGFSYLLPKSSLSRGEWLQEVSGGCSTQRCFGTLALLPSPLLTTSISSVKIAFNLSAGFRLCHPVLMM